MASLDAMTDDRELSDEVVKLLRARHEIRANQLPDSLDPLLNETAGVGFVNSLPDTFTLMLAARGSILDAGNTLPSAGTAGRRNTRQRFSFSAFAASNANKRFDAQIL